MASKVTPEQLKKIKARLVRFMTDPGVPIAKLSCVASLNDAVRKFDANAGLPAVCSCRTCAESEKKVLCTARVPVCTRGNE